MIRCRTLASELRARGADVRFICRSHPGNASKLAEDEGFQVMPLPAPEGELMGSGYAAWLGTSQEQDAEQTRKAMDGNRADWLIVDHYALDACWEREVRPSVGGIMAIDDLANRLHDCDVLLDQSYGADTARAYETLVPLGCRQLLGPRYALLRPEYRQRGPRLRRGIGRVLVFFGGADIDNATGLALEALSAPDLSHLDVDVVIGPANPHREAVAAQAGRRGRVTLHGPRPHLADLMDAADLAIGAGGATAWERLCMGLPAITISIAENQVLASLALAEDGLIAYAGALNATTARSLGDAIRDLLGNEGRFSSMSDRGPSVVDGLGGGRVAELMIPSRREDLHLRDARASDAVLYFGWVNETEVRKQSLNVEPVSWEAHSGWFSKRIASQDSYMFVLEARHGVPVGQIRFDVAKDGTARLSYLLDPVARGRSWAALLVRMGLQRLNSFGNFDIYAEVKNSNPPSQAVFEGLGFRHEDVADQNIRVYRAASRDF